MGHQRRVQPPVGDGSLFGRPARVWALALIYLAGAGGCAMALLYPMSHRAALPLIAVSGIGCLLLAVGLFAAGRRVPALGLHLLLFVGIAVVTVLVASSHTRAGAIMTSFGYPWACLYASHFMDRRAAYGYAMLASAGYAIGIAATGLANLETPWLILTVTVLAVNAVTANLVAQLRRQSESDPLTGLPNRAGLARVGDRELALAERHDRPLSVAVVDLDGLKAVNDNRGHAAGDALLSQAVAGLSAPLRATDLLARIGGDEFALLMPDTDAAGAGALLEHIRGRCAVPFCAGISSYRVGDDLPGLLHRADTAMYRRKHDRQRATSTTVVPAQARP